MIDLTGQTKVRLLVSFNDLEGSVTIDIKDEDSVVTFGTIKFDQSRLRPFTDALSTMVKVYYDDLSTVPQGYRMNFDFNNNNALVAFG